MVEHKVSIDVSDLASEINKAISEFKAEIESILYYAEDFIEVEVECEDKSEEEDTPKFKVGDVLTGIDNNGYFYTTDKSVLIVTGITDRDKNDIRVKIIDHKEYPEEIGREYEVGSMYFQLITDVL